MCDEGKMHAPEFHMLHSMGAGSLLRPLSAVSTKYV